MSTNSKDQAYALWDRRNNVEENLRLNSQHKAITHAILDGQLIHPSIDTLSPESNIADLGCGTGVWLGDVAKKVLGEGQTTAMGTGTLVGFDVNAHAFDPTLPPSVRLIEHDCTQPFEAQYIGTFDLVNIRGLAYAVATEGLSRVVKHAVQLLSQFPALPSAIELTLTFVYRAWWISTVARDRDASFFESLRLKPRFQ